MEDNEIKHSAETIPDSTQSPTRHTGHGVVFLPSQSSPELNDESAPVRVHSRPEGWQNEREALAHCLLKQRRRFFETLNTRLIPMTSAQLSQSPQARSISHIVCRAIRGSSCFSQYASPVVTAPEFQERLRRIEGKAPLLSSCTVFICTPHCPLDRRLGGTPSPLPANQRR
jgi:hypothetical protein